MIILRTTYVIKNDFKSLSIDVTVPYTIKKDFFLSTCLASETLGHRESRSPVP